MSETVFIILLISSGLVICLDLLFIACCLILSGRIDKEDK